MTTIAKYSLMDRLLFGMSPQTLKTERRKFIFYSIRKFILAHHKLFMLVWPILFTFVSLIALRLKIVLTWIRLKSIEKSDKDQYVCRLYRSLDADQYRSTVMLAVLRTESKRWLRAAANEWQTRIPYFWKTLASFRRSLKSSSIVLDGRHRAPYQNLSLLIPRQRVYRLIAVGIILVALGGQLVLPFLSSDKTNVQTAALSPKQQADLAVPDWATAVSRWKDLVYETSQDVRVVVSKDQRQTNMLSESVLTVSNTGKVAMQRYTPGQERLLYLLILLGSNGDASHKDGLCPLDQDRVQMLTAQINATTGTPVGSISGKDSAKNSLILCGYLINSISDQLLNSPAGSTRYVGSVPTTFARDLAYNWASGDVASRTKFADTFAQLYTDWTKPESPTYKKLRKE